MYAAAEGKSTLGIPKSVGKEFTAADKPGKLPARKRKKRDSVKSAVKAAKKRLRYS